MDRNRTIELLPIITAFAEGKEIKTSSDGINWKIITYSLWDNDFYRIK